MKSTLLSLLLIFMIIVVLNVKTDSIKNYEGYIDNNGCCASNATCNILSNAKHPSLNPSESCNYFKNNCKGFDLRNCDSVQLDDDGKPIDDDFHGWSYTDPIGFNNGVVPTFNYEMGDWGPCSIESDDAYCMKNKVYGAKEYRDVNCTYTVNGREYYADPKFCEQNIYGPKPRDQQPCTTVLACNNSTETPMKMSTKNWGVKSIDRKNKPDTWRAPEGHYESSDYERYNKEDPNAIRFKIKNKTPDPWFPKRQFDKTWTGGFGHDANHMLFGENFPTWRDARGDEVRVPEDKVSIVINATDVCDVDKITNKVTNCDPDKVGIYAANNFGITM